VEFSIKSGSPEKQRSACVVVGVFEPRKLTPGRRTARQAASQTAIFPTSSPRRHGRQSRLHAAPAQRPGNPLRPRPARRTGQGKGVPRQGVLRAIRSAVKPSTKPGSFRRHRFPDRNPVRKRSTAWRIRQAAIVARKPSIVSTSSRARRRSPPPAAQTDLRVDRRNELARPKKR
jgi:leucyl aminopeptidase